ncbi:DUF1553 domain-containing protein [Verrucomicrobium spinosum]|uniref:DUF1553 domain-containing protein n=1 Tax=Verrucomicrobium spinosum TaxID=2736 RepID=UPI00094628B1|nr:DUF1553 domain-containing protein [Verrucomicrobium spinosum]
MLLNREDKAKSARLRVKLDPVEKGARGKAMLMKGDDEINIPRMGDFKEYDAFSFAVWLQPGETRDRATVVACSRGGNDDGRGYEVVLENEVPSFALMHFFPGNEIRIRARTSLPLNQWSHLAVTYDGSSRAEGMKMYINGELASVEVVHDHLKRDISRREEWGDIGIDQVRFTLGGREHDSPLKNCGVDEYYVFGRGISAGEVKNLAGVLLKLRTGWTGAGAQTRWLEDGPIRAEETTRGPDGGDQRGAGDHGDAGVARGSARFCATKGRPPPERGAGAAGRAAADPAVAGRGAAQPARLWPVLVSPQHPLVARVAVNRIWQMFFGRGLVGTPEDFGTRGELPSHPELLDWLACDFREHGWDVKRLCRMIALSGTFGQSAIPGDPMQLTADPANKWLARGPVVRLAGEELRDQALAASGLFVDKVGGPSVYPYLPLGIYRDSGLQQNYVESQGEGLYRRSLYTFWRRTLAPPNLAAFDAPTREFCVMRREKTSTPVQALVLLNDPQYVEAQRVLAARVLKEAGDDDAAACATAFRLLLGRLPTGQEQAVLLCVLGGHSDHYRTHLDEARAFLQNGHHAADEHLEPARVAAMAMVVRTLMSHVEAVNR